MAFLLSSVLQGGAFHLLALSLASWTQPSYFYNRGVPDWGPPNQLNDPWVIQLALSQPFARRFCWVLCFPQNICSGVEVFVEDSCACCAIV